MSATRRRFSAAFKAKVAIEAIKGQRTIAQMAGEHQVYPHQILAWKKQLLSAAAEAFGDRPRQRQEEQEERINGLLQQIGQLSEEMMYLKKKLPGN